jgi:hypothetical protein
MKWSKIRIIGFSLGVLLLGGVVVFRQLQFLAQFPLGRAWWYPTYVKFKGTRTVEDVVILYGPKARRRLQPDLAQAGILTWPPELAILAFKQAQVVEIWGKTGQFWTKIKAYPFTATSGVLGPKLREGDRQIPEGVYGIAYLNPNSGYHLALKISYPNAFDLAMAQQDGRANLGGDIFLHGKNKTVGCIPVGDEAIEEIFLLVATAGLERVQVIVAPVDFRKGLTTPEISAVTWTPQLYTQIMLALAPFN